MSSGLILPLILAVLSILMADNLDTIRTGKTLDIVEMVSDGNGIEQTGHREWYMYIMSRFCYCFVNVAIKVFLFKQAAFQKAWSRISEAHNLRRFEEVMEKFNKQN